MLPLSDVLFFLLYFRLSDVYFSNQFTFRSFHCSSLTLLSLKNTIYYGKSILDPYHSLQTLYLHTNQTNNATFYSHNSHDDNDFCLKIIPVYFVVYIFYDLKHCHKRTELLIHHIVCLLWAYNSIAHFIGFISFIILAEGITFAYTIDKLKNQLIYRLIFTFFVRFPIWTISLFSFYPVYPIYHVENLYLYVFNIIIFFIMILMDCIWFTQNFKKLKKLCKCERDGLVEPELSKK
jgi:hypothetical protein